MKVVELMKTHIVKISPEASLADAVDMMDLYQLTSIAVVDTDGLLLGVIHESTISRRVFNHFMPNAGPSEQAGEETPKLSDLRKMKVSALMEAPAMSADEGTDATETAKTMFENNLTRIPVTTDNLVTGT